MFFLRIFALVATLLLISSAPAHAQELRFGYDEYPPLAYTEDGQARGESVELVKEACARLGFTPVFKRMPFARLLDSVRSGVVDAALDVTRTPDRQDYLYYPSYVRGVDSIILFSHDGWGKDYRSLNDVTTERVGVVRGYYYGEGTLAVLGDNVRYVKDSKTLFKMLNAGRFDIVLGHASGYEYYRSTLDLMPNVVKGGEVLHLSYYIPLSKKFGPRGQELADMLGREIAVIREELR